MLDRITPVVKNLLILNVLVFIATHFLQEDWLEYFVLFKSNAVWAHPYLSNFKPYQVVTHMFGHGGFMHILFNMFALASIGPIVERVLGSRKFLEFYLFTGVVSGLMVAFLDPAPNPVLGASGAISGILVAFAYYYPRQQLYLMFIPYPIEARKFVIGFAAISVGLLFLELFKDINIMSMSHFGHLAGMAAALLYGYGSTLVNKIRK